MGELWKRGEPCNNFEEYFRLADKVRDENTEILERAITALLAAGFQHGDVAVRTLKKELGANILDRMHQLGDPLGLARPPDDQERRPHVG